MKKIKMIMIILCTAIFIAMGLSIKVNAKNAVSVMEQKSLDDVSSEEKGPIDDIDKVKGVRQIMAAGVIDEMLFKRKVFMGTIPKRYERF